MRRYHNWLMALGIAAAVPGVTLAGPLFKAKPAASRASQSQPAMAATAANGKAPSNQKVADAIAKELRNAKLQGYNIEVQYQNGVAILSGTVASPELRATAQRVVSQV